MNISPYCVSLCLDSSSKKKSFLGLILLHQETFLERPTLSTNSDPSEEFYYKMAAG